MPPTTSSAANKIYYQPHFIVFYMQPSTTLAMPQYNYSTIVSPDNKDIKIKTTITMTMQFHLSSLLLSFLSHRVAAGGADSWSHFHHHHSFSIDDEAWTSLVANVHHDNDTVAYPLFPFSLENEKSVDSNKPRNKRWNRRKKKEE